VNDEIIESHTEALENQQESYKDTAVDAVTDVLEDTDIISVNPDTDN
jgi:hypothetical protein